MLRCLTLAIFLILVIPLGKYSITLPQSKNICRWMFNPIDNFYIKFAESNERRHGLEKVRDVFSTGKCGNGIYRLFDFTITEFAVFNPNGADGMEASLSFNTIISFYDKIQTCSIMQESGLSYGSQLCVIVFMMFTSAASGYAACGIFAAEFPEERWENFMNVSRVTTRILIPFSFVIGLLLVSRGVPQTLQANETYRQSKEDAGSGTWTSSRTGSNQASGNKRIGFFGANSTTPFENPTVISNIIETISMMILRLLRL